MTLEISVNNAELSYSQLNTWDRCEYLWYLKYDQKWELKEKKSYQTLGSMIHEFLAMWYKDRNFDAIRDRAQELFMEIGDEPGGLEAVDKALWLIDQYVHYYVPEADRKWDPREVEWYFEIEFKTPKLRTFTLVGYIDLLVNIDGRLCGVEHKSHNSNKWTQDQIKMDPQFAIYQYGIKKALGLELYMIVYNMINTYDYKDRTKVSTDKLFSRELSYRTDFELKSFIREVGTMVDEVIEAKEKRIVDPLWIPRRSLRRECDRCDFRDACSMGLKGANVDDILEISFKKKSPKPENLRANIELG